MKELKIERFIEKTENGEEYAALAVLETGGFAIMCRMQGNTKVNFQPSFGSALELYHRCATEVIGGFGILWLN